VYKKLINRKIDIKGFSPHVSGGPGQSGRPYYLQKEPNIPPAAPQKGNIFPFVNNFSTLAVKLLKNVNKMFFYIKNGVLFLLHRLILIYV